MYLPVWKARRRPNTVFLMYSNRMAKALLNHRK